MKMTVLFVALLFLSLPLFTSSEKVDRFQGGTVDVVADLSGSGYSTVLNITIPAECYVLSATMNVSTVVAQGVYPKAPEVLIDDTVLWAFNGTGYGAFGGQETFIDNTTLWQTEFPIGGGTNTSYVRLPESAIVQSATAETYCSNDWNLWPMIKFDRQAGGVSFGHCVANAGDLNGDGIDDIIIGARDNNTAGPGAGAAFIYYGGAAMDAQPDVVLTGGSAGDHFGVSVSGAGDVNGDGYDDVIVGAYFNGTGGYEVGSAYIYFGGIAMDNSSDLSLIGIDRYDYFGVSVSTAGDVNGDGFDDVIVGAYEAMNRRGEAYIYFGGRSMDNISDMTFTGAVEWDRYGNSVASAGDVNNDGFGDIIVGSYGSFDDTGQAYLYYGGPAIDNISDVTFYGAAPDDLFGCSVSGAGDLNGDGYSDVMVGAPLNDENGYDAGRAYIYLGGQSMDNIVDVELASAGHWDKSGGSVSTAGDVNRDGYDDVIVGSLFSGIIINETSSAYIFFGGRSMDNRSDVILTGAAPYDKFGCSVADAGDMDGDGYSDVIIGAGNAAYIYHRIYGMPRPCVSFDSHIVWNTSSPCNGTRSIGDFSQVLNDYLLTAWNIVTDGQGNSVVDIPVEINASGRGNITLSKLKIMYTCKSSIHDFADVLNSYIATHKADKDAGGNLTIPIGVRSSTPGKLRLLDLNITYDAAPKLIKSIPKMEMDEDTVRTTLLDLYEYFQDDRDPYSALKFSIESAANYSMVNVTIFRDQYLSADALAGDINDNWTGVVSYRVRCADSHGSAVISNPFDIVITNVNDPPVVTSTPPANATAGVEYAYQLVTADGDNDTLDFSLARMPEKMTISTDGKISWTPYQSGAYIVSAAVSDGQATAYQNFIIEVANELPRFTSSPDGNAAVGIQYSYEAKAADDNGDILTFGISSGPEGMSIDSMAGMLIWIPARPGAYDVSLAVYDGKAEAYQKFTINVSANYPPFFSSDPTVEAIVGVLYLYDVSAIDGNNDTLNFTFAKKPVGMSIDSATGRILWTPAPSQIGNNTVILKVTDGRGGEAEQAFIIKVVSPARPECIIFSPTNGTKVRGILSVKGTVMKGIAGVVLVQVRLEGGEWLNASGIDNWTWTIDTTKMENGPHVFEARAFDGGNYSDPYSLTLIVANPQPHASGGNNLWWILPAAVLIAVAAAGLILWRTRRKTARPRP